jgi:hypothetical protein
MALLHGRRFRRRIPLILFIFIVGFYLRNSFSTLVSGPFVFYSGSWGSSSTCTSCQPSKHGSDQTRPSPSGERKPSRSHRYSPDGLLHVNPNGPHPIYELIQSAEEEWERKLDRASQTLEEAVAEYKRRYKRAPPQGFDDW